MPSVDITQQAIVVEAPVDVSVVEFTSAGVTVEVPSTTLVLEFGTAGVLVPGSGLTGGGTLTGNVPIGLSPATVASLLLADTAVQPGANLSAFVDDVGYATDAEVFALLGDLGGAYQPLNEQLTSISGLATTVFGRSFLTLANEAAARTLIGVYSSSEVLSLLALKANASHTHTTADITGGISWSNLTGIPLTFPPGSHTHVKADVTDFAHTHLLADVTDYIAPVLAHSGLTGLAADDHTQYHTDARGDARYYTQGIIDSMLSGLAVSGHTHDYLPLAGGTLTSNLLVTHGGASYTDPSSGLSGIGVANTGTSANYNAFGIVTGVGTVFQVRNNGDVWALRRLAAAYFGGSTPADLNVLSTVQNTAELFCTSFGPTNGPGGANYYSGLYFRHNISSDYGTALVTGANSGEPVLHLRQKVNGTWGSYRKVYHEGNFDPATYLPLTGGTITGAIVLNMANAYIRAATNAQDLAILFGNSYDSSLIPIIRGWGGTAASNAGSLSISTPLTGNYVTFTNNVDGGMVRVGGTNKLEVYRDTAWKAVADVSQLSGGSYLPLTGGTLTGNLSVTGTITASGASNALWFAARDAANDGFGWYTPDGLTGYLWSDAGAANALTITSGGNLTATNIQATGYMAFGFIYAGGFGSANTANTFYSDGYGAVKFGIANTSATGYPVLPDNANFVISYESHAGGYGRQFFYPDNDDMYTRLHQAGSWGTWHKQARHVGSGYLLADTSDVWSSSGWARALSLRSASSAIQWYNATRSWGIGNSGGTLYFMHTTSDTSAAPGMTYPMYNDGSAWHMTGPVVIAGPASIPDGYGLYLNGNYGSCFIASHSDQTYGSCRIGGSKNGYSGIRFDDAYQDNQIMVSNSSNEFGLYSITGGWKFYYNTATFCVQGSSYKPMPWHDMGGTAASARYSRGTGTPTGGADGDVYFQYV